MEINLIFLIISIVLNSINLVKSQEIIKIGAFFDETETDALDIFKIAIGRQNVFNKAFRLEPIIKQITSMDGFQAEQAVCEMIDSGAVAIIGPKSIYISDVVGSICNQLNVPHIISVNSETNYRKSVQYKFTRNIYPDSMIVSSALTHVIQHFEWKKFGIIYDSDESLIRLNDVLQIFQTGVKSVSVHKFPDKDLVKPFLKDISKTMQNRIIIDCSIENTIEIIRQGLDVRMMGEYMTYLITSFDSHLIDIPEMKEVRSNITAIRLMRSTDVEALNILKQLKENRRFLPMPETYEEQLPDTALNGLRVEAALVRDIITLLSNVLSERKLYRRISTPATSCEQMSYVVGQDMPQYWREGRELLQNIDTNKRAYGITGPIQFDPYYKTRSDFYMEIVELEHREHSFKKVAEWSASSGLVTTRSFEELLSQKAATIHHKVFSVVSKTGMPYLEYKEAKDGVKLSGNDQYEGFVKDFMDEIARVKGFQYKLYIAPDNHQGNYDPVTGKWSGLIGEILEGRADLAICDLTITYERKTLVDFSSPFMTLGISILYGKPRKEPPGLLAFLKPLHTIVWLYMATGLLFVSLLLYFLAKITDADWLNPHPCDENPEELENIWNLHNCIWLTVGSIMQQGCDILPKGVPTRLAVAVWWFFALIVISSYTANLAAFLTKEQMEESISNVEDLAKESKIKYGLLAGGSTETFFKESNVSIYQKMWATMEHADSVFMHTNEEGIERVKQSNRGYAYFMESSTIEYIIQTECNLTRVGGWLDSKAYGIGMPMNSPYRDDINEAILLLKEDRTVQHLKEKWWITNNIRIGADGEPVNCTKEKEINVDTPELDMGNVVGIFIVLAAGFGIGLFIGILHFLWHVRKVSISQKITPYEAFVSESLFACQVWNTKKPVAETRETMSLPSINSSLPES